MTHQINISEASVYVGTYHKYNEGSIFGKWLNLSDYADKTEFYTACKELHNDEEDPEFMFQDYENIPEGLISEYGMSNNTFEVIEAFENMDENQKEPFLIWCNNGHRKLSEEDITDLISAFGVGISERILKQYNVMLHRSTRVFSEQLFDGYNAIFLTNCLLEYADTKECDRKLKEAIHLLFGHEKMIVTISNDK